ncbi:MAG: sodium:solute symporter [Rikenellaceae bacterium]|nr:sodium:solute symporter [Rikenellaceae bacterium]
MTPAIVISTILIYIALLFAVAYISGRRADNQGFFVGNRRSPWWAVMFAMIGASMSGVTFVSVPGMVAADHFSYLQMSLGFVAGQLVIAFVLVPLFYRMQLVSIYEYLENRFGTGSYRTGAWFFFISKVLGAAVRIFLVCVILQMLVFDPLGLPFALNVAATMALVWLYTRGGVKSLIWTDSLKTLCLLGSVGLCIWYITRNLGMDWGSVRQAVLDHPYSRIWFFDNPDDPRYFFKQFFAGLFMVVAMTGLDQDMMQRSLSCKNTRDSQKNVVIAGTLQLVVIAMFLILGILLYLFMERNGIALPAKSDQVFPLVATDASFPLIVGILFVLGLISSTYSAAGSALTALTTSFTVDILGAQHLPPQRLTRLRKRVHLAMTAVLALVIAAFELLNDSSVISAVYTLASYTYGPILGMFAFGILTRRKVRDGWVPAAALLSPLLCFVLQRNSQAWLGGYTFGYELLIINALFTFIGMWALSTRPAAETETKR